jgi:hypothetical protein
MAEKMAATTTALGQILPTPAAKQTMPMIEVAQ